MTGHGNCTEVTPECPVSATVYGYEPNLPIDATLCVAFIILAILQLGSVCFFHVRTWSYMIPLFIGCVMEIVGYIGRLIMHHNPWSTAGTATQLICLIVAPSFTAAAISVTFKHIVVHCGAEYSLMRPRFIPLLMIGSDFCGIVIQFLGAGIVATTIGSSDSDSSTATTGNDIIVVGIAFQVFILIGAGAFMAIYWNRFKKAKTAGADNQAKFSLAGDKHFNGSSRTELSKFKMFCWAITIAFVTVFIRCIYRLIEMASGWGSDIMRNEASFLVCDGLMVVIANVCLTIFQPGFFFAPMMRKQRRAALAQNDQPQETAKP